MKFVSLCNQLSRQMLKRCYCSAVGPQMMESTLNPADPFIINIVPNSLKRWLQIEWSDGVHGRFPFVWLRDNCPAPHTYTLNDRCHARHMMFSALDINVEPVHCSSDRHSVTIEWPGRKLAKYKSHWLRDRNIDNPSVIA